MPEYFIRAACKGKTMNKKNIFFSGALLLLAVISAAFFQNADNHSAAESENESIRDISVAAMEGSIAMTPFSTYRILKKSVVLMALHKDQLLSLPASRQSLGLSSAQIDGNKESSVFSCLRVRSDSSGTLWFLLAVPGKHGEVVLQDENENEYTAGWLNGSAFGWRDWKKEYDASIDRKNINVMISQHDRFCQLVSEKIR